jgi:glycerol-3-phosphate dehydrogenase
MPPASPAALSTPDRARTLDALEREHFDSVVVGGGITGAGVAREAALRGLRVALLEARDFAAGTSSRSSKLIHGGLRYLAMGDVPLVRDTALERKRVFALAPHLAERRWMLVPARSYAGLLKFRAGLASYETLGAVEQADRHRNWDAGDLAREEPLLRRDRFPYACVYREYLTDVARLVKRIMSDSPTEHPPMTPFNRLTAQELVVLRLVAEGLTNQDIADKLFLSVRTVKSHLRSIFIKLDVHNRAQAVAEYLRAAPAEARG